MHPPTHRAAALALAALALAARPAPAQHDDAHAHATHAEPAPTAVHAAFSADEAREWEELEVRVRLTDPATGAPVTGAAPMAWVDVRRERDPTALDQCRQRVGGLAEATQHLRHGELNVTRPVDDLNGHYVVALARGGTLVVIDPEKGFGRTQMLTAVPLGGEGAGWAATPGDHHVVVALPERGEVAAVNTHTWRVEARISAGERPTGVHLHPDGRTLWVTDDAGRITTIDAERLEATGTMQVPAGPHALAFSTDGRRAFVASRAAGTVTVLDAVTLARVGTARTGPAPVDVAWSARRSVALVADEEAGTLTALTPDGAVAGRTELAPGLSAVRVPHAPAQHGGHTGHGGYAPAPDGRHAFVVNPRAGTLQVLDLDDGRVIRTLSGAPEPDQVAFTATFAYVRAAGTPAIAMIPLADPTAGAVGPHDYFPAGGAPPGSIERDRLGDLLVPQPGMHDALYAVNPAERMVYSYHYMEGMPVPHGGLTTYGFTPRSARVVSRRVRETEPGVYAATVRLERAGEYDLVFRVSEPLVLGCFPFTVARDPSRTSPRDLAISAETDGPLRSGPRALRFRVRRAEGGAAVTGIADLRVALAATDGWSARAPAAEVEPGVYEAAFDLPAPGMYFASFEAPSRGVTLRDLSPVRFAVEP